METGSQCCKILQLSDCTMMYILSYLDATSLFNLSRTCLYFKNIIEDPRLWRYVEARNAPNSTKKVVYVCERINDKTTHLLLRAESKYEGVIPQDYLLSMSLLENLRVLALENQRLDGKTLTVSDLPKVLEELSLKKTHVKNGKLFFQQSFHAMRNLKVLILDECNWVDSNFFMSIAKYENLEILSIIKCMQLHLNVFPCLSVARHGCRKLKLIDCRFNTVGNEILRTFDSQKSLLALYFQSMSSYESDFGKPFMKCPLLTNEYHDLISQNTIKNHSLDQYKYMIGDIIEELPESVLYKDPYPDCTCGYKNKMNNEPLVLSSLPSFNKTQEPEHRSMAVDDYIDFHRSSQRFICRKHVKELNKLPKDFKNFFYQNQKKFYPGFSDNDSDSDDDRDCCMFGLGKSQQMIVLRIREVDDQGNTPEPEVIDISQPVRNVLNVDLNEGHSTQRRSDFNYVHVQPSTSRQNVNISDNITVQNTAKRKANCDENEDDQKKSRLDEDNRFSIPKNSEAGTSRPSSVDTGATEPGGRIDEHVSRNDRQAVAGPSGIERNIDFEAQIVPGPSRTVPVAEAKVEAPSRQYVRVVNVPINELQNEEIYSKKVKLRRLSLRGYRKITDVALHSLKNLNLDLLDVTHTGVTKEGVEKFLTLNPNCRVIHPDYCICKPVIPC